MNQTLPTAQATTQAQRDLLCAAVRLLNHEAERLARLADELSTSGFPEADVFVRKASDSLDDATQRLTSALRFIRTDASLKCSESTAQAAGKLP